MTLEQGTFLFLFLLRSLLVHTVFWILHVTKSSIWGLNSSVHNYMIKANFQKWVIIPLNIQFLVFFRIYFFEQKLWCSFLTRIYFKNTLDPVSQNPKTFTCTFHYVKALKEQVMRTCSLLWNCWWLFWEIWSWL